MNITFNPQAVKIFLFGALGWIGASAIDELMSQYFEIDPWYKLAFAIIAVGYGIIKG